MAQWSIAPILFLAGLATAIEKGGSDQSDQFRPPALSLSAKSTNETTVTPKAEKYP
jgi:hypothetical protein